MNGGKCGICGDKYDAEVRSHEVGGMYATGQIVQDYIQGQKFSVIVDITANHRGHFEFRLCPYVNETEEVTQECLDQ